MTNKDKQLLLLLKDLCVRLPYGVIVAYKSQESEGQIKLGYGNIGYVAELGRGWWIDCKPYLRPMSSMTEEEKEYIKNRWCYNDWDIDGPSSLWREKIDVEDAEGIIDYFNEHHFDYRGLIEMGLALEAKEEMYEG